MHIKNFVTKAIAVVQKILAPSFDSISWQILYRVEILGIGMALIYLIYDFFFNKGPNYFFIEATLFPIYLLFLYLILKFPGNKIVQNLVVFSNFTSMIISFLFIAGDHYISTPTVIDFSLSLLVVTMVYRHWERIFWTLLHAAVLITFITLSIFSYADPQPDHYILLSHTDVRFAHIEIFSRLIFIFILGFTLIKDYDRQRILLIQKNEEINHLNKNLERLVELRTEKLNNVNKKLGEYSFMNSHKVRAPLARIMGLLNLIRAEKAATNDPEIHQYLQLLQMSAEELDQIIKEMNTHLAETKEAK